MTDRSADIGDGHEEILPGDVVVLTLDTMFIEWLNDDIPFEIFLPGTRCLVVSLCPRKLIPRSWKFDTIINPCVILHNGKLKIATTSWMVRYE